MKYFPILLSNAVPLVALLGIAGCGGDGATPPSTNTPVQSSLTSPTPGASSKPPAAANGLPTVPADAKYTIICTRYAGGGHVQQARLAKDNLTKATGRREFYVIHEDQQSTLYYGYYKQIDRSIDPAEAQRAEVDMNYLRSLQDSSGNKMFPGCLKEALPVADPDGPPEYDLARIDSDKAPDDPTRRFWSIAIAAYTVDAEGQGADVGKNRKQLAVESVLAARKAGYEAYYYNGPNVSTVTIGAWPRSAIKEQESNTVESRADTGQELVVAAAPLPNGMAEQIENSGRDIKVFQPKIEVVDTTLSKTQEQFRQYSVNGRVQINRITDPKTGKAQSRPQPSFLVEIPRLQPSLLRGGEETTVENGTNQTIISPLTPGSSGGQLRSIGR